MATPEEVKELRAKIVQGVTIAKTEEDLEEVSELADDAVAAGWLTQREVDALWDDFVPDPTDY
jgi:polyhydroxyalkanoate synthesis regulator phasin